jgi:hypothetical protein
MFTKSIVPMSVAYAWDKEGQPSIVELVQKNDSSKLPSNFPINEFLKVYQEWKNATYDNSGNATRGKTSYFAELRDMHQAAGINKSSNIWKADEEMVAFAKYVESVKATKDTSRASQNQITATSTTPAPVIIAAPVTPAAPAVSVAPAATVTPIAPSATPATAPAEKDPKAELKAKVEAAIKGVVPKGYVLQFADKSPNTKFADGGAVLIMNGGKRVGYGSIADASNGDLTTTAGIKKWFDKEKSKIENGGTANVVTLPKGIEKSKKYPNTVIKAGTQEQDYSKGEAYNDAKDEENIFPAFGYIWKKPDDTKDFSVEKVKEVASGLKYTISGVPSVPLGLSIVRIVEVGSDKQTRVYFSKALKSAVEDSKGEARSAIDLEDGEIDEDFDTVSIDGVIYTVAVNGQTIEFTRDSQATGEKKKEDAETQKFLAEVKSTVLTVDGLPGKNSISGLTVDKDGNVQAPLVFKDLAGNDYKNLTLGDKKTWKDSGVWDDNFVINGIAYDISITWTSGRWAMKFVKNSNKTKEYKVNIETKLIEKNTEFVLVKQNNKALTDCATWDICTDAQKPLVTAAIATNAPLAAVKAIQKEMKQKETGVWDIALLNALMHQKKK